MNFIHRMTMFDVGIHDKCINVFRYCMHSICHYTISIYTWELCYYIHPKFIVFIWLAMLKERCLLMGPKHEVHSYIHATSVGQMFGTKQNDIYWNDAFVLHGV
jgi:hypothetical protein